MSQVILFLIQVYRVLISPFLHAAFGPTAGCRYEISCSAYAEQEIKSFGVVRGSIRGIQRVISCHP